MATKIYRSGNKNSLSYDRHSEICELCAKDEEEKGFDIDFDKHLSKFIHTENGISYYDGEEINCNICCGNFE